MSKTVKKNVPFLQLLKETSSKQRNILLDHLTPEQLKTILELVTNLLRPEFPLSKHFEDKLKRHKSFLRQLGHPGISNRQKRELINKRGAIIVLIVQATLPFLKDHATS